MNHAIADIALQEMRNRSPRSYSGRMTDTKFQLGDDVDAPRARGTIIAVRATPSGNWIFGVEDATGEVAYYTSQALRHLPG